MRNYQTSSKRFPSLLLVLICLTYCHQLPTHHVQAQQVVATTIAPTGAGSLSQLFLQPPIFIKSMDSFNIKENTPLSEIVYTLEAQLAPVDQRQQQPVKIFYSLDGTNLFSVDKQTGQVRVLSPIDREQTGDSVTFQVQATPYYVSTRQAGPPAQLTITVFILDENDNAPKIERLRMGRLDYDSSTINRLFSSTSTGSLSQPFVSKGVPTVRLNVSENTPTESFIVDLIEAVDVDKASTNPLSAICLDCEPEFELRPTTTNLLNDRLDWSIVLVKPLVHIPRNNVRKLHVIVSDGKFNSSIVFEITIDDIQNKPPQFIGSTTCVIKENTPIDKVIMTLQAIDGDTLALDDVPSFLHSSNPSNSRNLGRQIIYEFVSATGQSSSIVDDFKLHPLTGQIQVANRLDRESYLSLNGVLSFQVRASELSVEANTIVAGDDSYESMLGKLAGFIDRSPDASTTTDISIILVDINDNEPHWLNASEIASLNMNNSPSWHNSLPNDRDTGRNYHVQVYENTPAGSPITSRNEMFVFDLDNDENSEFNITLVDPFNLFDIEPKHAVGFAMVTLKLVSNPRRPVGKLLDYENINERSYIIQLYATETKTNERFSSKAQVQINVLDVNDNPPEFKETAYIANIREDAPAGKTVKLVQATDKDEISAKRLRYSLLGRSAYLFDINPQTGLVTVAKCESISVPGQPRASSRPIMNNHPSQKPCIDYELQRSHHLMVEASDGELSSKVPLTIFIDDASDNPPVFSLPIVDVVIEEGSERLEPPIKIEATDVDQTSVLSYSIVEGNFEGLFTINNITGEIQLTRPIRIAHDDLSSSSSPSNYQLNQLDYRQQQLNKMTLIVQATDGHYEANGTVRIDILDANDNAPRFLKPHYEKEITESYGPEQHVLTVRAFDLDRGNNAKVSYKIQRGSHSQFKINQTSGEISVASNAIPFDSSKRDNYTLEVVAYDHGSISKSSSVLVYVKVLDTNRRSPEFEPRVQRISIHENTLNNTIIHRMTIADSEQSAEFANSLLVFEPGPIEGLDKYGQPVTDIERLESIFSVSTNTGDVAVNSGLDHDFAAHVNLTIYVASRHIINQDTTGSSFPSNLSIDGPTEEFTPRSVGYLVINILDDNSNPPSFAAPWTPNEPELYYQMYEELPIGSILAQLVASDADTRISHYKIEPQNDYFELTSPQSGVIVNKRIIDYDSLMSQTFLTPGSHRSQQSAQLLQQTTNNNIIQFNVLAFDSGFPQLSAKAIVSVEILPLNDWDCKFEQTNYEVHVRENSQPDTVIVQVRANDLDFGEQHNLITYSLIGDHRDYFNIDSRTGVVTISTRGSMELDRERLDSSTLILTAVGRDEQNSDSAGPVQSRSKQSSQQSRGGRSCSSTIRVHIDDVNDNPPIFTQKLYEVTAYDTDTVDVPLIKLMVRDEDSFNLQANITNPKPSVAHNQASSAATNVFRIISGNVNDSFNITSSGMIYAIKPLNESLSSISQPIQLRVQVRQQTFAGIAAASGVPTQFTDECLVRISWLKINRYAPEWRIESLKAISVEENKKPGTLVTQLRCIDRDIDSKTPNSFSSSNDMSHTLGFEKSIANSSLDPKSPIRYWIKENGMNVVETNEFKLDPVSGKLVTRIELDREAQDYFQLVVSCEDNGKPQSLESTIPLFITVVDIDDNKPEFVIPKNRQGLTENLELNRRSFSNLQSTSKDKSSTDYPTIRFQVEEHQGSGMLVGELKAIDRDLDNQNPTIYCIIEGNEFLEFSLDRITGILYTNQTLDREKQSSYDLLVKAMNDRSSCDQQAMSTTTVSNNLHLNNSNETRFDHQQETGNKYITSDMNKRHLDGVVLVKVDVLDINDNAPIFKQPIYRAAVHHKALMNTLITQVAAYDPDSALNGSVNYKISEILMYKTNVGLNPNHHHHQPASSRKYDQSSENIEQHHLTTLSKPIKLIQYPFRIDRNGDIYSQQLLTQYQLMSMFVLTIEATEQSEPWRSVSTKLEIYIYETNNQLKMSISLHPRLVEAYRHEIETMLSNATKYTAIINRARSYHANVDSRGDGNKNSAEVSLNLQPQSTSFSKNSNKITNKINPVPSLPTTTSSPNHDEPSFSNIHLVFVDNYRIVNPNLVMEKFDLTSAQLFSPQMLTDSKLSSANSNYDLNGQRTYQAKFEQSNEFSSLIDKIALASVQSTDYRNPHASSLIGIDWLENPSVLFVTLASLLFFIGLLICLAGCCCTSRIKDHIIKSAMDKLVRQQTLQAKINERVLAATNQAFANTTGSNGQDYMLQQGGLISAFDATKGCMNNNYENMSILQRAMESGEFIDPNYTTLNNGRINLGAHYYDASDLEEQQQEHQINGTTDYDNQQFVDDPMGKQMNGSTVSLSLVDNGQNDELNHDDCAVLQHLQAEANGFNGAGHQLGINGAKQFSKQLYNNGAVSNNQRQRQQLPPANSNKLDHHEV